MTIMVTGATGTVGRSLVAQLLEAGERVRTLTRNPAAANLPDGVEVVHGDLARLETLPAALAGVERMHLISVAEVLQTATEVVELATKSGVRRITVLSSRYTDDAVEQAVEAAGVEWTHLWPTEFMANTLEWAGSIRAERLVRAPFANWTTPMIHEADVAAVAATALLEDGHAGRTYEPTGPEPVMRVDAVRAIGAAIGRDVRFQELTPEQAREHWRSVADSLRFPE